MNLTKAAAEITLMIALVGVAYLIYESTIVRTRYKASVVNCMDCTAVKEAVAANWRVVEDRIQALKAAGKRHEAEQFAKEHAGEKPVNIDVPCSDCETPAPDYSKSSAVAVVGLIVSMILFGVVKPRSSAPPK